MVSKKNFSQGVRSMPYRKPPVFANNICQIPDNPGYLDFNNMDFNQPIPNNSNNAQNVQPRKKNQKGKQRNKQQNVSQQRPQQFDGNGRGGWNRNRNNQQQMPGGPGPNKFRQNAQRNFQPGNAPPMRGPVNNSGRMRMMPPIAPHGFQRPPIMPPMPPHIRPMRPPPVVGPMPPNAQPFLRRSARRQAQGGGGGGGNVPFKKQIFPGQMPPMMTPMPPMMAAGPPPMPRMPMPFNNAIIPKAGKVKKPNPKAVKKVVKGKSTIKTLKNLENQYPLDKPWVTDEIRAEHGKKVEIENKLKGKKDDDLFAQFKTQRDKFVGMYESARDEYLKKEAAEVKTKDANDKQTNDKTADKSGKGNDKN